MGAILGFFLILLSPLWLSVFGLGYIIKGWKR